MDDEQQENSRNVDNLLQDMFGFDAEEDPFQDSGSEYQPSICNSTTSTTDLLDILEDENHSPNITNEVIEVQLKPRKRVRQSNKWKKNIRKEKRSRGEEYFNVKGVIVPPKQIDTARECNCQKKCHEKILPSQQINLFNSFYAMGNYDLQSSYLFSLIKVLPKKTCRVPVNTGSAESRRSNSRVYQVPNDDGLYVTVCKEFFKKLFGVSDGRLSRVLKNKLVMPTPPTDQRGKHVPSNKTPKHKIKIVKDFINKFPKYESHYTLHKSTNRMYLAPDLSLPKLISIYKNETLPSEQVSNFIFRKVFNEQFNLSFHPPITDSCKKCDSFKIKIEAEESPSKKNELEVQKKLHLLKAESARNNFKIDKKRAEDDSDLTVIVFDLMKTLPTPVVSTGICYYKRQLWTYCLGIHNAQNDEVTMCVWNETIASRGPQEIGSCLLRYIKEKVNTKNLIMYSDQCGGQNRNIKMAALCQYIVAHPNYTVENIDHKFYVSGHSYLACDQDFGLVEKKKKFFKNIFVPDDWVEVIKAAREKNPFNIMKMTKDHFFSTKKLENNITNRKVTAEKSKVQWLQIQWLLFNKMHEFTIFFKYSNNAEVLFENVDLKKRNSVHLSDIKLDSLYPDGKPISSDKKKDLLALLPFIPPVYHGFYTCTRDSVSVRNDLDVGDDIDSD